MSALHELEREGAARCLAAGIPLDGELGGAVHQWVMQNCNARPGTEFFIVFGIVAEMADMQAQAEGYRDQFHRAAELAYAKKGKRQ